MVTTLVAAFYFGSTIFIKKGEENNKTNGGDEQVSKKSVEDLINIDCTEKDLHLETFDIDRRVKESKSAMTIMIDNCHWPSQEQFYDVTGDGVEDIVLTLNAFACASCHTKDIAIIDGTTDEVLFYEYFGNVSGWAKIRNLTSDGFEVKHSFEWNSIPNDISKATETVSVYSFDEDTNRFKEVGTYTEPQSSY